MFFQFTRSFKYLSPVSSRSSRLTKMPGITYIEILYTDRYKVTLMCVLDKVIANSVRQLAGARSVLK